MTTKSNKKPISEQSTFISPSPRLALLIVLLGLSFIALPNNIWPAILITSFGIFLLIQTYTLRLEFTKDALIVWQLGKELRRFPFKYWISWKIFLSGLPGLLYFREEASPHLLPIIFNISELEKQLREKVGDLEISKNSQSSTD
tara:strand:+ start:61 stop:492 length:432 start_codon:yes stop_codon:yes gene_type:complete